MYAFFKICFYNRNLTYAYLAPIFDYTISIKYSLPFHTNLNGYCVPEKPVLNASFQGF